MDNNKIIYQMKLAIITEWLPPKISCPRISSMAKVVKEFFPLYTVKIQSWYDYGIK